MASKESYYLRNDRIKFKTRNVLTAEICEFMRKITRIRKSRLLRAR